MTLAAQLAQELQHWQPFDLVTVGTLAVLEGILSVDNALVLAILGGLAALRPWELGTKADAFAAAPPGIRPEWYFMFMFETLKFIPAKVAWFDGELLGILGFGAAFLAWTLVPFFDGGRRRRARFGARDSPAEFCRSAGRRRSRGCPDTCRPTMRAGAMSRSGPCRIRSRRG